MAKECPKCKSTNTIIADLSPRVYECLECDNIFCGDE